jgi:hypothetical protein
MNCTIVTTLAHLQEQPEGIAIREMFFGIDCAATLDVERLKRVSAAAITAIQRYIRSLRAKFPQSTAAGSGYLLHSFIECPLRTSIAGLSVHLLFAEGAESREVRQCFLNIHAAPAKERNP